MEVVRGTAAVWLCPKCGHGSPDPRDERAHLDAHRQLRAFFEEWEAGTEPELVPAARRRSVLYAGCALLVLLAWSLTVFSNINRATDIPRSVLPPAAAPAASREQVATPPAVTAAAPPPASTPAARSGSPSTSSSTARSATAVPAPAGFVPPSAVVALAPTPADPAAVTTPPAPQHLLSLCVLGVCLTLL